jgi:predicted TIM-barrel fold metal-dependent hydrolase
MSTTVAAAPKASGAETALRCIDADGHVVETRSGPEGLGDGSGVERFLEPRFRATPLPYRPLSSGGVDLAALPPGAGNSTWDPSTVNRLSLPGGSDGRARLVDMDAEGIDVAVLYPTLLLRFEPDVTLFRALHHAYNSWLEEYCSADRSRLIGVGLVPLSDIDAAVAEMERCVNDLGFKAVMVRPCPYIGEKKLNDPVYDPFWDAAQSLGCPIGIHPFSFNDMPNVVSMMKLDEDSLLLPGEGLTLRQGLGNAIDLMVALGWFVAGGTCEKFPRLKVAFLEGSGGWICTMLERLDHHIKVFGSRYQKDLPSDVFRRQCWISFDPDEVAMAFTAEHLGADRIIWASDYPHPDAKIPGVVAELREATEGLTAEVRRRIVGENAAELYGL